MTHTFLILDPAPDLALIQARLAEEAAARSATVASWRTVPVDGGVQVEWVEA